MCGGWIWQHIFKTTVISVFLRMIQEVLRVRCNVDTLPRHVYYSIISLFARALIMYLKAFTVEGAGNARLHSPVVWLSQGLQRSNNGCPTDL